MINKDKKEFFNETLNCEIKNKHKEGETFISVVGSRRAVCLLFVELLDKIKSNSTNEEFKMFQEVISKFLND